MGHPKAVRAEREYPTLPLRVEDGAPRVAAMLWWGCAEFIQQGEVEAGCEAGRG
jgi:hypothetical protein